MSPSIDMLAPTAPAVTTNGFHAPSIDTLKAAAKQSLINATPSASAPTSGSSDTILSAFLEAHRRLQSLRNGDKVVVNGHNLSIPEVVAAGRYGAQVVLDDSPEVRTRIEQSQKAIDSKLEAGKSVYGISTGFGGSADTRTNDHSVLGKALLQHQHIGILPSGPSSFDSLPLGDPVASLSMPEAWVRSAILIRINSLIRGHSGVRWDLIEAMTTLLRENITPFVPLRGSISASGDLSPLSYIAGTLIGNPFIRCWDGPKSARQVVSSCDAYAKHSLSPLVFSPKEHLGLLNGTAFSAAVGSLALNDAVHLAMMTQVLTALGTEAMLGVQASHDPFIHKVARPHPGQVEAAENIWRLLDGSKLAALGHHDEPNTEQDVGVLRQDRYPLRTAPQFIGPQLEDILSAWKSVTQECNSTTDNPLVDGETGQVHHGGNFQAMHVTNAMEKTRLSLHHLGKLLFSQSTELLNPTMNRGLPPNLAGTDPAVNYHCKGLDIATAAYVSELGYLANPVSTHIQSAEMHNQAVNSLALVSARATITALDVLTMLVSSYLYILCQALDLRALNNAFNEGLRDIIQEELHAQFASFVSSPTELTKIGNAVSFAIQQALDSHTLIMDAVPRLQTAAAASTTPLVDFFSLSSKTTGALSGIPAFRAAVASKGVDLLQRLREEFLTGARGPAPAASYLGNARPVYEFVRVKLGVKMHGTENFSRFDGGFTQLTIGQNVSVIYESIRDGQMQDVIASLF
ncbi:hypothetical protein FRC04_007660 [Tulasnella sp. 424]|nr:hypothetical protein FRC04_007660 [Tulasnella sp. 424]KAG8979091.1 hypothetical protein FRC05_009301 [Tulasnella sp. 425]